MFELETPLKPLLQLLLDLQAQLEMLIKILHDFITEVQTEGIFV
jgi:hypothetical protein